MDTVQLEEKITPQDKMNALAKIHQQVVDLLEINAVDVSSEETTLLTSYAALKACPGQLCSTVK